MSNESCLAMLRGFGHLFHLFLRVQEAFEIVAGFCRPKGENHRDTFFFIMAMWGAGSKHFDHNPEAVAVHWPQVVI